MQTRFPNVIFFPFLLSLVPLSACSPEADTDVTKAANTMSSSLERAVLANSLDELGAEEADLPPSDASLVPTLCATTFTFRPSGTVANVRVAGEWQGFDPKTAPVMKRDSSGVYKATVALPMGLQAYKFVYDAGGTAAWVLDPSQGRRKYVSGIENSAVKVADCRLPTFAVSKSQSARSSAGSGTYSAKLLFRDGVERSGSDAAGYVATLEQDGIKTPLTAPQLKVAPNGDVTLSLSRLSDGKYRVVIRGKTKSGRVSEPLRLVFWIESEPFSWQDALVYVVTTDRFRDGDPFNNPPATAGVFPQADWKGGDLEGVRQAIADGTFDKLGVRALRLTPFATNPTGAYLLPDGVHKSTAAFHGYWPVKAREVEPRIGGAAALAAVVREAHKHGIRVLQDYVLNQVHSQHEYFLAHPEWFRTDCLCGDVACPWDGPALGCEFTSYLPDVNHTVPEANAQFTADAVWWLDNYDLDGLHIDAVRYIEESALRNLAAEVRETFEPGGTRYFLTGETLTGWGGCRGCSDDSYKAIAKNIGSFALDGQMDSVLYADVSMQTFAYGDHGMIHADYWVSHGLSTWPAGAIMTPYLSANDWPRFATLADYRGQDAAHDRGLPYFPWASSVTAPGDAEPYRRARIAFAWLLGLPGAPLIYYGDEYGQWGGSSPSNAPLWRQDSLLSAEELGTLAFVRKLGLARKNNLALRRGAYVKLHNTSEDLLVFGRKLAAGQAAVVGINRTTTAQTLSVDVSGLEFASGVTLRDLLGSADLKVNSGKIDLTLPASGAVIYAP